MQRLHIDRRRGRCPAPRSENIGGAALKLRFPSRNLIGVDVEMLGQLGYRPIALDGCQRHLRLEGRGVVPARSSVHGLSCSRRSSPLSGRNSTYRPVQISGAGSIDGRREKITAMINAGLAHSSGFVAFPTEIVFSETGKFVGFAMRKVGGHKPIHQLLSPASRKTE